MGMNSLNHCSSASNFNFQAYDLISEYLNKACALTHVALNENFGTCSFSVIHDYLWVLEDILEQARNVLENSLNKQEMKKIF